MKRKKSLVAAIIFVLVSALGACYAQGGKSEESKAFVIHVIDGDTVVVMLNGIKTKVRLQGVNTPEKDGPYTKAQPMNETATRRTKELSENKTVTLVFGGKDRIDKYGRLLAYVVLPDGRVLNEILIIEGLAVVYRRFEYSEKRRYIAMEAQAKADCKGIWKLKAKSCKSWW
jgi:micrococcal nuclease